MEKKIKHILSWIATSLLLELLLVFAGFQIAKSYIHPEKQVIRSDGKGYYDYLPAIFIYHDLSFEFRQKPIENYLPENYDGLDVPYKNTTVNKYSCGNAVVWAPAFLMAHAYSQLKGIEPNGYSKPYQDAILLSAIGFLAFGLFFIKKLLKLYDVPLSIIIATQIIFAFGSQLFHFTYVDGSFSHVYSFAAIAVFLYCFKQFSLTEKRKYLNYAAALLGLIIILRPVNILIFLFTPFLFPSIRDYLLFLKKTVITNYKSLIIPVLLFAGVIFIQLLLWFLQTGDFVVYSYNKEGFNFGSPNIMNALFSFQKGLFVYTPIFLLAILLFITAHIKKYQQLLVFLLWFLMLMYVTSSWHSWFYGMSFGMRPIIDYAGVFMLLFALALNRIKWWIHIPVYLLGIFIVYVQIVQTYQYKNYILHWDNMDYAKYKTVFLHTENRYKGLLWSVNAPNDPKLYNLKYSHEVNLTIPMAKKYYPFYDDYLLAYSYEPDTNIQCNKIGIQYTLKNAQEDDAKMLINVLNKETNQSLSYNEFHLFHHITKFGKDNHLNYIVTVNGADASKCKILVELNQLSRSKTPEIVIEKINFYE